MNSVYNDDCLNILEKMPAEAVDMVYLDPPFYSQNKQSLADMQGRKYEFSDVWPSRASYLEYMEKRLWELKRVLKQSGSIFLHCDTSASHHLRIMLDDIFGERNFRSEIIWFYKRWSNSKRGLLPAHQTIFFYSKSQSFKFHKIYGEYSPTTNIDQVLQARERNDLGKSAYKFDENGIPVYAKEKQGVPLSDVWEIPFLNPKARERTGYPTQKPIELLERIIKICTDENDLVLDPFCGSGTSLVAAKLQGRRYIGIDNNPDAVRIALQRLAKPFKTRSGLLIKGIGAYKTKSEEELAILSQFDCNIVQRNKGIDALSRKNFLNAPVAIKIQRSEENFLEALKLLCNAGAKKGCRFMVLLTSEADWQKRYKVPENVIVINKYEVQMVRSIEEILKTELYKNIG